MPTLGEKFRRAREKKKVTCSQAAAATHMKIQHVEAMERDDFSRMAAPMYAKGFIKIYAEYLGLDPAPLIQEYGDRHEPKERLPLLPDETEEKREPLWQKIPWAKVGAVAAKWAKPLGIAAAVLVLAVGLLMGLARCTREAARRAEAAQPPAVETRSALPVIGQPPDPYMEGTDNAVQPL